MKETSEENTCNTFCKVERKPGATQRKQKHGKSDKLTSFHTNLRLVGLEDEIDCFKVSKSDVISIFFNISADKKPIKTI